MFRKSTAETKADFSKKTALVQYPLAADEIERVSGEYEHVAATIDDYWNWAEGELDEAALIVRLKAYATSNHRNRLEALGFICLLIESYFKIEPNITQIFAILGLLHGDDQGGRLAQIKTGEGKSTVITILALLFALEGKSVHIFTSAHHLAIRDQAKYAPFFKLLGLDSAHCCDHQREMPFREKIIYGTHSDFEFLVLYDAFKTPDKQQLSLDNAVALVDEIDSLLLDSALIGARIAMPHPTSHMWLLDLIFDYVKAQGKTFTVNMESVQATRAALNALEGGCYQAQLHAIDDVFLVVHLQNAKRALYALTQNEDYIVEENNTIISIIDRGLTDEIYRGMRWKNGLHGFLEKKHGIPAQAETLTLATISNPAFFTLYSWLFAVSGTLGGQAERDEIAHIYRLNAFDVPPHLPSLRQAMPNQLSMNHWASIKAEVMRFHAQNRPVLILCDTIDSAQSLFDFLSHDELKAYCQLFNEQQVADKEHIVRRMGHAKTITCATRIAARGTDVKLTLESKAAGGLHVISTFFAKNTRVEEQGIGRAARQGEPGSFSMNLSCDDPLIQELMPKGFKKELFADQDALLAFLQKLRDIQTHAVSTPRTALSMRAIQQHEKFRRFIHEYQYFLAVLEQLPWESIHQSCQTLKEGRVARDIPTLFEPMVQSGQQLLSQQKAGYQVNWISFLHLLSQTLQTQLKVLWGLFLEKSDNHTHDDFDAWLEAEIAPYTRDPLQGFLTHLTAVLQCPSDALSVSVTKLPEKNVWRPRFFVDRAYKMETTPLKQHTFNV